MNKYLSTFLGAASRMLNIGLDQSVLGFGILNHGYLTAHLLAHQERIVKAPEARNNDMANIDALAEDIHVHLLFNHVEELPLSIVPIYQITLLIRP